MGKAPAFQFYVGDWIQDTRILTPSSRGIWADLLCFMWRSEERGQVSGTYPQLARLLSASESEIKDALHELSVTKVADVTVRNEIVTITNRRMFREERERILTRNRVKRFRNGEVKRDCNEDVTPPSSSSSSLNTNTKVEKAPESYPQKKVDKPFNKSHPSQTQKNSLKVYTEKYCHREGMKEAIGLIKEIGEYRKRANPDDKWSYEFWGKLAKDDFTDFPKLVEWLTIIKSGKDPSGQLYKLKDKETLYKLWNSSLVSQNCSEKANIRQHEKIKFEQPNMSLIGDIMRQSQGVT